MAADRESYARMAVALGHCSFLPGGWDKRFARNMSFVAQHSPEVDFSERQRVHLIRLVHKYRRQIPTAVLVLSQDEAETAADRRVAEGKGALADFTPARAAPRPRPLKAAVDEHQGALPL